jgi:glucose/arabinose dehydrogenase
MLALKGLAGLSVAALVSVCGGSGGASAPVTVAPGDHSRSSVSAPASQSPRETARALHRRVVITDLTSPWGLVFLPGGQALVSERDPGNIVVVRPNGRKRLVKHVKGVFSNGHQGGEAGLLGLAISPRFAHDHWVYAYMSARHDNRIVRMRWHRGKLGHKHVIHRGIPRGLHHNGGRIGFGPDGMLYATTGETGVGSLAQNLHSLGGKILRMTPRGKPAPGNPFKRSVVYSYGHRNVEGLAWDRAGRLWATEFGEHAYDELNLIRPGHNYGWPMVEGHSDQFTDPKAVWHTEQAGPSGVAIRSSGHQTVAWVAALTGERLYRVRLNGPDVTGRRTLLRHTLGRIRTVAVAPSGRLWVVTSNTDGRATPHPHDDKIIAVWFS